MIQVRISDEALGDLSEGYWFYEAQDPGLGDYFADSLRKDINELKSTAGIHRIVYQDYHRHLSKVFPYGVYYTLEDEVAVVWAVIELRRDPKWIREKLDKTP